jgi:co-chaperonin GroES (HSP10)
MLPLGPRLAVTRHSGERILDSGIVLLAADLRDALTGTVTSAGSAHAHGRPLEIGAGDRIIYSSRVDSFVLDDGSTVDIVEENSVIGKL